LQHKPVQVFIRTPGWSNLSARQHNASFWDEDKALRYLSKAVELGASVKDLEELAKKAINWSSFFNPLREELGDELYGPVSFKKSSD